MGGRGVGNFTPRLRWNYWLEYFLPLNVGVTNSAVPGSKATDKDGYVLELKGESTIYSRTHWSLVCCSMEDGCTGTEVTGSLLIMC